MARRELDEADVDDPAGGGGWTIREGARFLIGVFGFLATGVIGVLTQATVNGLEDPSTFQVTQVYAEGIFRESLVLGLMIAAYIASRSGD